MEFKNKQEFQHKIDLHLLKRKFEFIVKRSTYIQWKITYMKDTCKWPICVTMVE